jgi:hypothetical protein
VRYWERILVIVACTALLLPCGCVRRRMTIRTTPPGASVFVDKQYIGTSPASTDFIYYGTREVEVVLPGYRTEKVLRKLSPPWYQIPPLDFISESLWPREIRDQRIIDIAMIPEQTLASDVLLRDANTLRLQAAQGIATPLPPTAQPTLPGGIPAQPIDPTYPVMPPPMVTPPAQPTPGWRPGQILGNFFQPGGQPPVRIPEAGILPGGGYRPEFE